VSDFIEGNDAGKLVITCRDQSGAILDLTTQTARVKWRNSGGVVVREMTKEDAAWGVVSYRFATDELVAPKMSLEIELSDAVGKTISSSELIQITVRKAL
jgi:hypothetical protein